MIELKILQVEFLEKGYKVLWEVEDAKNLFRMSPFEIYYGFALDPDPECAINNLLAVTLPILAKEYKNIRIISGLDFDERTKNYWNHVLQSLNIRDFNLYWEFKNQLKIFAQPLRENNSVRRRIALLYGGGVESTFALSVLHTYNPVLISIIGEKWMNNDSQKYSLKRHLEDKLILEFNLEFQRVTSNAFSLINKSELYKNYYVSGLLFYWHSLPVCKKYSVQTLYKSSELEESLNWIGFDLSLSPAFLKEIIFKNELLFLPLYNCYSKIKMFAELTKTPFIRYIYSCYHNTGKRWCGECSKCYRISEFCDRVGIDRSLIGMQEGIVGLRESGHLTKHFWRHMDIFYGRKKAREISQAFKYFYKKGKRAIVNIIRSFLGQRADNVINMRRPKYLKTKSPKNVTPSLVAMGVKLPRDYQIVKSNSVSAEDKIVIVAGGDVCFDRQLRATPPVIDYSYQLDGDKFRHRNFELKQFSNLPLLNLCDERGKRVFTEPYDSYSIFLDIPEMQEDQLQNHPFTYLRKTFLAADVAYVNLETPLGKNLRVTGMFLSSPIFAYSLANAGIRVVSLANNHAFDAGESGLLSTLDHINQVGIKICGAGKNISEAKRPATTFIRGRRIAWINCTQKCNVGFRHSAATDSRAGILPMDPQVVVNEIAAARKHSDIIIVCPHWSIEESISRPEPLLVDCAHLFIDAGADVILGTGSHVVQPIELYKGKPIVYCMGNLVFGHGQKNWDDNILVQIHIKGTRLDFLEILPISGRGSELYHPKLLTGYRVQKALENLKRLCSSVGTTLNINDDKGIVNLKP